MFFRGLDNWQSGLPKEPLPGMLVLEFFSAGPIEKKVEVYSLKIERESREESLTVTDLGRQTGLFGGGVV